jgi:putative transposase
VRAGEAVLRQRLRELAAEWRRFGDRRRHGILRREGYRVNHKRVARRYRAEGLAVRRRTRKRAAPTRCERPARAAAPNEPWGLDCVSDSPAWGRRFRRLTVGETVPRESLAIEVDPSLPGERVVRVLDRLVAARGTRRARSCSTTGWNSPARCGPAGRMSRACGGAGAPGKPVQNALVESFGGRLRDARLNAHGILSLAAARRIIEAWRQDDTEARPHRARGYRTPDEVRQRRTDAALINRQPAGRS